MTTNKASRPSRVPGKDALGDRIKALEAMETERRCLPGLPLVLRLDGRSFSKFTRGMRRPYDQDLADLMVEVTKALVSDLQAVVGYTQSDEISLILEPSAGADGWAGPADEALLFGGRFFKLTSVAASMATARFVRDALRLWPDRCARSLPVFDCRVIQVPNREAAVAAVAWRELDATKNAVSMAARALFPQPRLQGKTAAEMQEMMFREKGVNFNDYPARFKRGVYVQRRSEAKVLDPETLARIPVAKRPAGPVTRSRVACLDMPPIRKVLNPVEVLFERAAPVVASPAEPRAA